MVAYRNFQLRKCFVHENIFAILDEQLLVKDSQLCRPEVVSHGGLNNVFVYKWRQK